MSRPTANASTATATLWKRGVADEFGRGSFAAPVVINVCYDVKVSLKYGGARIDKEPNSVMYKEVEGGGLDPKKGDFIAKGDQSAFLDPVAAGGEVVTGSEIQDCSFIGDIDDLMVTT